MTRQGDPYFKRHAEAIVANGFSIVSVSPRSKKPRFPRWQAACYKDTDLMWLRNHSDKYPDDSVGIACGQKVIAIDIDAKEVSLAELLHQIAREELGDTPLVRFGEAPGRVLLYHPLEEISSMRAGKFEVLSSGCQVLAFGIHPSTGAPYHWHGADPTNTAVRLLPCVSIAKVERFVQRASNAIGRDASSKSKKDPKSQRTTLRDLTATGPLANQIKRDATGRVIDGREAFLTSLTAREYAKGYRTPDGLAERVWQYFVGAADLARPKGSNKRMRWSRKDTVAKARAICRKAPSLTAPRSRKGYHPARHLNGHRKPGYWTPGVRERQAAEAARRITTPSVLAVNMAMLENLSVQDGQCFVTVCELAKLVGCTVRSVQAARRELIGVGLWVAGNGVYVPVPFEPVNSAQAIQTKKEKALRVKSTVHPLYRGVTGAGSGTVEPVLTIRSISPGGSGSRRTKVALNVGQGKAHAGG